MMPEDSNESMTLDPNLLENDNETPEQVEDTIRAQAADME